MALTHGAGRSVAEVARLVYLRYSPDSSSRQVIARTKVHDDYWWTLGGMAGQARQFWCGGTRPVPARESDEVCEHLRNQRPGKLRDLRARVRYWHLTGQLHWPDWL
jgi:hypothetical protein